MDTRRASLHRDPFIDSLGDGADHSAAAALERSPMERGIVMSVPKIATATEILTVIELPHWLVWPSPHLNFLCNGRFNGGPRGQWCATGSTLGMTVGFLAAPYILVASLFFVAVNSAMALLLWVPLLYVVSYVCCFLATAFVEPGYIPHGEKDFDGFLTRINDRRRTAHERARFAAADDEAVAPYEPVDMWRYCKLCDVNRPAGAMHCGHCGHCVVGLDHHCPIFGTCIAVRNINYFYATLLYGHIGAWVLILALLLGVVRLVVTPLGSVRGVLAIIPWRTLLGNRGTAPPGFSAAGNATINAHFYPLLPLTPPRVAARFAPVLDAIIVVAAIGATALWLAIGVVQGAKQFYAFNSSECLNATARKLCARCDPSAPAVRGAYAKDVLAPYASAGLADAVRVAATGGSRDRVRALERRSASDGFAYLDSDGDDEGGGVFGEYAETAEEEEEGSSEWASAAYEGDGGAEGVGIASDNGDDGAAAALGAAEANGSDAGASSDGGGAGAGPGPTSGASGTGDGGGAAPRSPVVRRRKGSVPPPSAPKAPDTPGRKRATARRFAKQARGRAASTSSEGAPAPAPRTEGGGTASAKARKRSLADMRRDAARGRADELRNELRGGDTGGKAPRKRRTKRKAPYAPREALSCRRHCCCGFAVLGAPLGALRAGRFKIISLRLATLGSELCVAVYRAERFLRRTTRLWQTCDDGVPSYTVAGQSRRANSLGMETMPASRPSESELGALVESARGPRGAALDDVDDAAVITGEEDSGERHICMCLPLDAPARRRVHRGPITAADIGCGASVSALSSALPPCSLSLLRLVCVSRVIFSPFPDWHHHRGAHASSSSSLVHFFLLALLFVSRRPGATHVYRPVEACSYRRGRRRRGNAVGALGEAHGRHRPRRVA